MYTEARTWKWLVPAVITVVLLIASMLLFGAGGEWNQNASMFGFGIAGVFGLAALVNFIKYVGEFATQQLLTHRTAQSLTADALIMENAKGVHPETVRLIFGERQRAWMLRAGVELPDDLQPYSVLYAAPEVTDLFLWHFLRNSNGYRCMSKRMLSDKSYRFDPLRKTSDYDQYDRLTALLKSRSIITEHFNNEAPLWIPPWKPALVALDFGLEWDEETDGYHIPNLEGNEGA